MLNSLIVSIEELKNRIHKKELYRHSIFADTLTECHKKWVLYSIGFISSSTIRK